MKKLITYSIAIIVIYFIIVNVLSLINTDKANAEDYQVIPDEAIRLRILANSDNDADQRLKRKVRDRISEEIAVWVEDIDDIEEARKLIASKTDTIQQMAAEVLAEEKSSQTVKVEYGKNIQFPVKMYGNYVYPAGEYEAVLITLGKGEGANWWCVLFPPLCFLDFSFGTTTASEDGLPKQPKQEVKVKFFLLEWLGLS
ncbi:stage II sporulation protein R [Aciduricibacillus chroicocephali]|uniref:Stage II sporulation protein R n=1 Tax=Aciduricibacillus chroicocephali TaxID=3054939 RepID=A0ABY9KTS2_9BACI|nr:stage II sporulation protein R [Bacillaceae bacterium 44XB]